MSITFTVARPLCVVCAVGISAPKSCSRSRPLPVESISPSADSDRINIQISLNTRLVSGCVFFRLFCARMLCLCECARSKRRKNDRTNEHEKARNKHTTQTTLQIDKRAGV